MNDYRFIRLTDDLVVPSGSVFEEKEDGLYVWVPGFTQAWAFGGDAAEAIRYFTSGKGLYPVTENGILDIPSGWRGTRLAQGLMNPEKALLDDLKSSIARVPEPFGSSVKETVPSPEESINWDNVFKKAKEGAL